MEATSNALSRVVSFDTYREDRAHIYPSDTSLRWFIRLRREQLVAANAILKLNGRLMIDAPAFDHAVLENGRAAARGSA